MLESLRGAMAESFRLQTPPGQKAERYAELEEALAAVLEGEPNLIARLATTASMLAAAFPHFFWTGFYLVDPDRPTVLVVGPYQGSLGCLRIAFGRGVCGTAAATGETQIVEDVLDFPGHIACDPRSRSEIVAPVFAHSGRLIGVLDVDATVPGAFDQLDALGLQAIVHRIFG